MCLTFTWVLGIGTQILGLVLQTLCPHLLVPFNPVQPPWVFLSLRASSFLSFFLVFFSLAFSHRLPCFLICLCFLLPASSSFLFYLRNLLAVSSGWVQIHSALASASWIEEITVCTTMSGHFPPSLTIYSLSLTVLNALIKLPFQVLSGELHLPC